MLGFGVLSHSFRRRRAAHPFVAAAGFVFIGLAGGVVTCLVWPEPIFQPIPRLEGLSILLAPLGTGAATHAYGLWRRAHRRDPSFLATFWGGALVALMMSATRVACTVVLHR